MISLLNQSTNQLEMLVNDNDNYYSTRHWLINCIDAKLTVYLVEICKKSVE